MKKIIYITLIIALTVPKQSKAQGDDKALISLGFNFEKVPPIFMREQSELRATEWILRNKPDLKAFSISTIDFNGEKPILTLPAVSVITFKIQEFNHEKKYKASKWVKSNGKEVYDYGNKFVLYGITSRGWVNKNGIDFNKITWFLYDPSEWLNMISEYVSLASGIDDKSIITSSLLNGKLVNGGIKTKKEFLISFKPLKEDMYVVSDYSDDMKLIYNEKTLGFFLKKTKNLVRINRKSLVSIYNFLFKEN